MVKPGVNQVDRIARDCRNARMRVDARAPNSPRDRGVGVVRPRAMKPDMVSKSKVRQTMWRGTAGGCGGRPKKIRKKNKKNTKKETKSCAPPRLRHPPPLAPPPVFAYPPPARPPERAM